MALSPTLNPGLHYALIIGIDQYGPHHANLQNARADAEAVAALLTERYDFVGVKTLLDKDATQEKILDELEFFKNNLKEEDSLLIYFAGHGFYDRKIGYLVPHGVGKTSGYIRNSTLVEDMGAMKARHVLLIADSCFSGSLLSSRDAQAESRNAGKVEKNPSRWVLSAGNIELVPDGLAGNHSPFTRALLKALKESTAEKLATYSLFNEVRHLTSYDRQTPLCGALPISGFVPGGEFVFRMRNREQSDWQEAQNANTPHSYKTFLEKYPKSFYANDALKKREELLFAEAKKEKSLPLLVAFRREFSQSVYYEEAGKFIFEIEDEQAWRKAKQADSITSYEEYLDKDTNRRGKYRDEANRKIDLLLNPPTNPYGYVAPPVEPPKPPAPEQEPVVKKNQPIKNKPNPKPVDKPIVPLVAQEEKPSRFTPLMKKLATATPVAIFIIYLLVKAFWNWGADFKDPFENEMVYVEGGSFMMGDDVGAGYYLSPTPVHKVTVGNFKMAASEVTQAQWNTIMVTKPSGNSGCDNCPVENVSWVDAQEFIKKLNDKTGKQYRLPTEAEWEYAAKGGENHSTYTFSGSDNIDDVAWYYDNSGNKTHPVKSKNPNKLGLYDMSGNVWEWCQDTWHDNYQGAPSDGSAWEDGGSNRVLRGGSWFLSADNCRTAHRDYYDPSRRFINFGFRVCSAPQ